MWLVMFGRAKRAGKAVSTTMKTLFLLFDSLNRSALGAYGGAIPTPSFDRLAARSTIFDSH